jgi:hypothetical protein
VCATPEALASVGTISALADRHTRNSIEPSTLAENAERKLFHRNIAVGRCMLILFPLRSSYVAARQ